MKDELIRFETAKLAKSKGFNWKQIILNKIPFTIIDGVIGSKCYNKEGILIKPKYYNSLNQHFPAPTQSLLQKWLREVHDIHISIEVEEDRNKANIYKGTNFSNLIEEETDSDVWFNTYEEALEDTLVDCLNLIKLK